MKSSLHITASFDQPQLLHSIVEKLAIRKNDIGYAAEARVNEWQPVETASTEIYTSGDIMLSGAMQNEDIVINMPFITSFLFTCIKTNNKDYTLTWSTCLS